MSVVIGAIEPKEVLVDSIADKYVDPSVVIYIGATNAESGAKVCRISERRFCDFFEGSVAQVPEQPVFDDCWQIGVVSSGSIV